MEQPTTRYRYAPPREAGIAVTPAEMSKYVARYSELVEDKDIFPDIKASDVGDRKHYHVISHKSHLGPTSITTPHNFHMSILKVPPGNTARLHAHRLPEVFMVLKGTFDILWGDQGEHAMRLNEFDTMSVPVNVMRTFRNAGAEEGILQVIYDGGGEVLGEIFIRPLEQEAQA